MAAIVGKDGSFRIGVSTVTRLDTYNLDGTIDTEEVTGYGDTSKKHVATLKSWKGGASGTLDIADAQQAALLDQFEDGTIADVDARFYYASSSYWSGSAIVTNASIRSQVGSKVTVDFSFTGNGDLTRTA